MLDSREKDILGTTRERESDGKSESARGRRGKRGERGEESGGTRERERDGEQEKINRPANMCR